MIRPTLQQDCHHGPKMIDDRLLAKSSSTSFFPREFELELVTTYRTFSQLHYRNNFEGYSKKPRSRVVVVFVFSPKN